MALINSCALAAAVISYDSPCDYSSVLARGVTKSTGAWGTHFTVIPLIPVRTRTPAVILLKSPRNGPSIHTHISVSSGSTRLFNLTVVPYVLSSAVATTVISYDSPCDYSSVLARGVTKSIGAWVSYLTVSA